jgi:hypothetical protein
LYPSFLDRDILVGCDASAAHRSNYPELSGALGDSGLMPVVGSAARPLLNSAPDSTHPYAQYER